MNSYEYSETFHTPYEQYNDLNGLPFTVVDVIEHATSRYDGIDEESCPMFRVRINGQVITAWPEEILEI